MEAPAADPVGREAPVEMERGKIGLRFVLSSQTNIAAR